MENISKFNLVRHLERKKLLFAVNSVAALSIFYFGYDQGVMGGVNGNRNFAETMGFGHYDDSQGQVVVTNAALKGGINGIYYLPGCLLGAFLGGWIGDKWGRIRTIAFGAAWSIIGGALQASSQDHNWTLCARVFNGIGTGLLNAITPVWATETSEYTSRGQFVSIEFTVNIFGVVVAYWLEYGTSKYNHPLSSFIWRFPIAFQIVPLIILLIVIWFVPESPRWLVKQGRDEEARFILGRLRGETGINEGKAEAEFQDIVAVNKLEQQTGDQQSYWAMFWGKGSGKLHTGRRVQLVVWLQILQEWIGIAGITIYGDQIFSFAGIKPADQQWVSGLNDITYMIATLACVFTLDRVGRRVTLFWGAIGQCICCFLVGGLGYATLKATDHSKKSSFGVAATFFVFLYTMIFGATWLTVPWLYPAEIFPLQVRAKGNAWGVVGWACGNGWTTMLLPTIFKKIGGNTMYIFGGVNLLSLVIVWALYPETNQRTLEEMNLVFASDSIWNWEAEKNFKILKEQNPDLVHVTRRKQSMVDNEAGLKTQRGMSLSVIPQHDSDGSMETKEHFHKQ